MTNTHASVTELRLYVKGFIFYIFTFSVSIIYTNVFPFPQGSVSPLALNAMTKNEYFLNYLNRQQDSTGNTKKNPPNIRATVPR